MDLSHERTSALEHLKVAHLAADTALVTAAGLSAFLLRFEFDLQVFRSPNLHAAIPVWLVVKLVIFHLYRLDRRAWRFPSSNDIVQLAGANLVASAICAVLLVEFSPGFPRSVCILDLMVCFLLLGGRFLRSRFALESRKPSAAPGAQDVFIYGAGRTGVALLSELRRTASAAYRVRGFIDDDARLTGLYVHGQPVLGGGTQLGPLSERHLVRNVLIAMPSAGGERMLEVLKHCQRAGVQYRTVPSMTEIVEHSAMASQIREVDVQDLLARAPAQLDHRLLRERIAGKVVMVTGAGGSIGSELCRQLARFGPRTIVAFEVAETALFHLAREMEARFPDVPFQGVIGSVQNHRRVTAALRQYSPSSVYHAAAYKHVPIMESSVIEAVSNNVLGTHTLAAAARDHGVAEFVLISSDKAVRPTSVMGATKRLCEKLILDMMKGGGQTKFMAVRFGNVLGSSGSVIPLFKQQIAAGGPVTVTHPEMKRYFMTIPEAAQLVLQAASLGKGGEIFVLDMGEQVRIVDIARKLIHLSGFTPDAEIKIEFSGIRPGEKLYEELSLEAETTLPTVHRKIKIFAEPNPAGPNMTEQVDRLRRLCEEGRGPELVRIMSHLVPEYQPSDTALSLAGDWDGLALIGPQREPQVLRRAAAVG